MTDRTGSTDSTVHRVRLAEKFALFTEHWSPRIVGQVQDMHVKLAKLQGEFEWHAHQDEDEMFLVVRGTLVLRVRDQEDVVLEPGDLAIVPRGVEHCPVAEEEVHLMMIEPAGTVNTGTAGGERTVDPEWL